LFAILVDEAQPKTKQVAKSMPLNAPQPSIVIPAPPKLVKKNKTIKQKDATEEPTEGVHDNVPKDIQWSEVLEYIRTHHLVIYGVLQKADAQYHAGSLQLHFSYGLHKKKLDDPKYRQMLTASLVVLYGASPTIVTTSGKRPPKDSTARNIAAIMGGGEEVKIES
jgi:hypothetical protein